nr:MAG TPA: hypothetical protein [Caudoviricetes sp.]
MEIACFYFNVYPIYYRHKSKKIFLSFLIFFLTLRRKRRII